MEKSEKIAQQTYHKRQKERGLVMLRMWVPAECKEQLMKQGRNLRRQHRRAT